MRNIRFLAITCLIAVLLISCSSNSVSSITAVATQELYKKILTITGLVKSVDLTMADLQKMPSVDGYAGIMKSTGTIEGPYISKGVLVTDLLALVESSNGPLSVEMDASDGYAITFSTDQFVKDGFTTYDPKTGTQNNVTGLKVILAYQQDGEPLDPENDGNLKLSIISDQPNQVIDGHWSVRMIDELKVKPLISDFVLHLEGAINEDIDRASYEAGSAEKCHFASTKDNKAQEWDGLPLWLLVGRVDDEVKHGKGAYNDKLADAGAYTVEVIAKGGKSITFDSKRIKRDNNIILAYLVNGNPLPDADFPMRLVGSDIKPEESIGQIEKIVLHFNK
jgi:DMSO/TMAO reductase YedYZ molybdopterin-dependent catalytic subunit